MKKDAVFWTKYSRVLSDRSINRPRCIIDSKKNTVSQQNKSATSRHRRSGKKITGCVLLYYYIAVLPEEIRKKPWRPSHHRHCHHHHRYFGKKESSKRSRSDGLYRCVSSFSSDGTNNKSRVLFLIIRLTEDVVDLTFSQVI